MKKAMLLLFIAFGPGLPAQAQEQIVAQPILQPSGFGVPGGITCRHF